VRYDEQNSPQPQTISVVIPVYNGAGWIGECIRRVNHAVEMAGIDLHELIIVDDGSTDTTVSEASEVPLVCGGSPVILSQPNQGRLAARMSGLERATGQMVLFIDTRVHLDENSLVYAFQRLGEPGSDVWTAHTVANTDLSPIAGFWQAIEHVAWRRYWRHPRRLTFGLDEFDFYPKGTTALLAPRDVLVEAFAQYRPTVDDLMISNDDTAVLRWVAERHGISIAPGYSCVYNSRTTLPAFLKHARHRGAVLIDGYLRPGARFSRAIVAVLALTPIAAVLLLLRPRWAVGASLVAAAGAGSAARVAGARTQDSVVLGVLAIPFGVFYLAGMWRGVFARVRASR
jgi:hypothetical protein